ncbi:GDSL-type esterase/lipase family protein [Amycolatopsis cynarae]|uniref:GDSL-type esterase/lipase family protein n=1 Tax=Amycolatopsis cynarae TaxID=2995223 RepID=A0ABY7B9I5_9PSEU|nr:GDSL-type esterase/lipase family protein [Amycolatopsis sp. HUAS 11-8]WAL69019.1 GDSL-type esterase/lipase family protein [Amycolatopsis sp. HUAS 11-8]
MRRYRWWISAGVLLFVAVLVGIFVFSGPGNPPAPPRRQGPPGTGPLTIVTLGDSTLSGEGTGNYTPDTNGANGDWCHRSPEATVFETALPGIEAKVNLACSGAPAAQVALGDARQWTEPSQAGQLAQLVKNHRVAAVVVAVGANDDPHFSQLISQCFQSWLMSGNGPCSGPISATWDDRVNAMVPKVVTALGDVKKVLAQAGYQPEDYQLVLQSYAAPIGPDLPADLQSLNGCPFRTEDLRWVQDDGVLKLSAGLARAAAQAGARFLDLSRAGRGHEACSGGADPSTEWFSRLVLRLGDLNYADRASHALQESFHPNANGHAQIGRCLTEFLATEMPSAACLPGAGGDLHPAATLAGVR